MAAKDLALRQFDVQMVFLHSKLPKNKRVYMKQPPGSKDPEKPNHIWILVKALYGMKQADCVWNQTLNTALIEDFGFVHVSNKHCLYVRHNPGGSFSIMSIHVNDTLAIGLSKEELDRLQHNLESQWKITMANSLFLLGIHLKRNRPQCLVFFLQTALINCIVEKFGQPQATNVHMPMDSGIVLSTEDCPLTPQAKADMANVPYRKNIGSMQYIAQATRTNIVYAMGHLAKFMANPGCKHWDATIQVLRYLKTTSLY
jgi:hypothetical protein